MKAVRIHEYGSVDVLRYEEAPQPIAAAGEVLIRVHASSVNPFDTLARAGYVDSYFHYTFPLILGTDVSGVVEEVGEGVTGFAPGDEVYTRAGVFRDGTYAEYVLAFASDVAAKPKSLDHIHAAALPHVTLTAWRGLVELADLCPGQTVLIHAAAGGVGHMAVQIARLRGAKVIGTSSRHLDFLHELGVDQAIDYSTTAFEDAVKDADVVLDLVGGDTLQRSWKVLKPGGMLVSTLEMPSKEQAEAHHVRPAFIDSNPQIGKVLTEIAQMVDSGQLEPHVSTVFPLDEVARAHEMSQAMHTHGKIILQVMH